MKGGADLHIFPRREVCAFSQDMISDARTLSRLPGEHPICGYAIVCWDKRGFTGVAVNYDDHQNSFTPPENIPHYAFDRLSGFMRKHDLID